MNNDRNGLIAQSGQKCLIFIVVPLLNLKTLKRNGKKKQKDIFKV